MVTDSLLLEWEEAEKGSDYVDQQRSVKQKEHAQ